MKVWIEQCIQCYGRLSWEGVATLVKEAHHNQDTNLTQREIDLAYGLNDKQESIFTHIFYLFSIILMYVVCYFLKIFTNSKYVN
jgi:hypothetical protein